MLTLARALPALLSLPMAHAIADRPGAPEISAGVRAGAPLVKQCVPKPPSPRLLRLIRMYSMQRLPDRSSADAPHAAGALGTGAQMSESCSSRGLTLPVGGIMRARRGALHASRDRKSTRLNSSH